MQVEANQVRSGHKDLLGQVRRWVKVRIRHLLLIVRSGTTRMPLVSIRLGRQGPRDLQVRLVRKVLLDLRVPQARKVRKACKDYLALQGRLVLPGHKASKVYQERKGTQARSVRWGLKDLKASKAHKVTPARKGQWVRVSRSVGRYQT